MNCFSTYGFIVFLGISTSIFAAPVDLNGNYWQCRTQDATNTSWSSKNSYQKVALNFSFALCKKNSRTPATCKTSENSCEHFISGVNVMPKWECSAFDRDAFVWKSNDYRQRDDAALAAQAYCKQKSPIPSTCYVNLIACVNTQEM